MRPLQAVEEGGWLRLLAPNRYVVDWVSRTARARIGELVRDSVADADAAGRGGNRHAAPTAGCRRSAAARAAYARGKRAVPLLDRRPAERRITPSTTSSRARATSSPGRRRCRSRENPGRAYNPLFIYGGVGLGKTHLMQAVGNHDPRSATRMRAWPTCTRSSSSATWCGRCSTTRSTSSRGPTATLDALLIDDIQFFANKERSQEEFFHTFNALLEGQRQVILTCDRYPKEVEGLEERLKSRFGWGLTVAIEPPELETCVAILMSKAAARRRELPEEVAFFIAKRIRSNVRELEGALRRVMANSQLHRSADHAGVREGGAAGPAGAAGALVTIENIQKTVAEYCKVRVADLLSKRRSRSIARPRQIAMALVKELTNHSLPEIGDAFGGRDHTTVLHACRRVKELRDVETRVAGGLSEPVANPDAA